jgi:hypothetical protein
MPEFERNARGWLLPTAAVLRRLLQRPELALVPESCAAEQALHAALQADPARAVTATELAAVRDADARDNYALFLRFRAALLAAGTLEGGYLQMLRAGKVDFPPLFFDWMARQIARNLLADVDDAWQLRAAELLFRPQRISIQDGQVLAGDSATLDLLNETGGFGAVGRLLVQGNAPLPAVEMQVLGEQNAAAYLQGGGRFNFLLDLTHEVQQNLGHGLVFHLARKRSGLNALARVLERWVAHFLGVAVRIQPLQKIDDVAWRWHLGLDAESSAILNDLYQDQPVEPARLQRLLSLFRLEFAKPQDMRADVAGKPVYLGLAMDAGGVLRLKPQNLLLNLPLAGPS